jgi:hypothetical protein
MRKVFLKKSKILILIKTATFNEIPLRRQKYEEK